MEIEDWKIDREKMTAVGRISLAILPDGERKIFKRNAIKDALGANSLHVRALVGELDGVRVYIIGNDVVLTKRNLRL